MNPAEETAQWFVDVWAGEVRRQDTLGRLTPIEFETLVQVAHAA